MGRWGAGGEGWGKWEMLVFPRESSSDHPQIILRSSSDYPQTILKSFYIYQKIIPKTYQSHHHNIILLSSNHHSRHPPSFFFYQKIISSRLRRVSHTVGPWAPLPGFNHITGLRWVPFGVKNALIALQLWSVHVHGPSETYLLRLVFTGDTGGLEEACVEVCLLRLRRCDLGAREFDKK